MYRNAPISEPIAVPDTYVSGIAHIEQMGGGLMRFTLFAGHHNLSDNEPERVIVSRIIMTKEDVKKAMLAVELALAGIEGMVHETVVERRKN